MQVQEATSAPLTQKHKRNGAYFLTPYTSHILNHNLPMSSLGSHERRLIVRKVAHAGTQTSALTQFAT